ncbi:glycosyltransferase family 25 protein [Nitrincola tapanii]|uniref:Glycosyltransferase family 25 protein n=1 Tax=Nitrincola tapanii TaxID=1708751 RepID=A0A5A9W1D0_9GAMM|nr:glycosyltransferase family 25 protein [Nitrincola tapanii]KAA0874363.1 glycosyltransferase family 25 protein [Nitrincola tapanii]
MYEVHVINLDKAPERYAHMLEQCGKYNLMPNRFSAITPSSLPDWLKGFFYDEAGHRYADLKPGEIGCYASHLSLIKKSLTENKVLLIMEDDLVLTEGFSNIDLIVENLPDDWGFVRLSNETKSAFKLIKDFSFGSLGEHWRIPNNMGAYLVHPRGAKCFLEYRMQRFRAIDEDFRRVWEYGAPNYSLAPGLAITNVFDSTIDSFGDRSNERERDRKRWFKARELWFARPYWWFKRWGVLSVIKAVLVNLKASLVKKVKGKKGISDHLYFIR